MSRSLYALLLAAFVFVACVFAACSPNNVTVDNSLQRYFDSAGVKGSFALFDNGQGHFTIYNLSRYKDSAYAPGRTFDIVQALVGLQTGALKDETTVSGAFRGSGTANDSLFRQLGEKIGKDSLKRWIDSLHYGNRDMGGPIDSCWSDGHLKITSDEQLGLIKRLYFDQLPFFNRPQKLVRGIMPAESNSAYRLVYKSGQVGAGNGKAIGWLLGWVEENKHPYFFVVNLEAGDPNKDLEATSLHIVKSILRPMGFFEGKK